ncbi:short-chain dehydrogenase/reductase SDR [Hyphomicrobium denitrificans ATCC 51888]|uniref:Short-chain dehydrogenase/reductase SDR n=1 Tax=Hyphomicrobium denitrificans (strain ATCC 51888 / DSM 1869 / NCIMB 11706 / TK 0415) TaxID=582899 RepID=D8JTQ3_HYPDA|nr:SDR family oxidoreductase [Hyphomicrobium denitrificans]ADJ22615.1 short-chain dehydrogenase/reductase SDR [Hyphomicrobium denitrificans ATCC 51888]
MAPLSGKKALVLGGSRGIGAAIVERLVSDGADTQFTYVFQKDAAQALATRTGTKADQLDSADIKQVTEFIDTFDRLDILVINAGIALFGDARDLDPNDVDRMIDINIRSPYHAAVAGARKMKNGGRIVVIGSVNGDRTPFPGLAAYTMTKAAVQGMVRGLARDFAPSGITVNNVQPGPVDTDLNPADGPMKEQMHSPMAIKRHATPAEVAAMVAYLVGPEASIVTGAQHTIDGGFGA